MGKEITAEEFFRAKIKELNPIQQVVTLSNEIISGEQGLRWAHEFKELHTSTLQAELEKANQQKPEIAWLPDFRIKELSENLNFRLNDPWHNEGMSTNGIIGAFLREVQSELKTRIQPSDLQKEVERLKDVLKSARTEFKSIIGIGVIVDDVKKEIEKINEALNK